MSLATEMATDARLIKADISVTVVLGAQSVTCGLNRNSKRMDMGDAGYITNTDVELMTVLADWTTAPVVNDKVTISSVGYRVLSRVDSGNGVLATLEISKSN